MEVREIVYGKLVDSDVDDITVALAIDEAAEIIKNYCHIEAVPEGLKYTWANMAVGMIQGTTDSVGTSGVGPLSSISMGDTSYSFATDRKSGAELVSEIANEFKAQLNRYRRGLFDDSENQ